MKRILILAILGTFSFACGGYTETIQKADAAYLKFVGNTEAISFSVDDGPTYAVQPNIELYKIKPGKHRIKVFRDNQVIVDRLLVIDDQITREISVP